MSPLKYDFMEQETRLNNKFEMSEQSSDASPTAFVWADWHVLFDAVKTRLKLTVVEQLATRQTNDPDALERVCAVVLECVAELEQLQNSLKNEIERSNPVAGNG